MRCSNCGNTEGFYKKVYMYGHGVEYYDKNGEFDEENGDLHECLTYKPQNSCYCKDCDKKLTKKELEVRE